MLSGCWMAVSDNRVELWRCPRQRRQLRDAGNILLWRCRRKRWSTLVLYLSWRFDIINIVYIGTDRMKQTTRLCLHSRNWKALSIISRDNTSLVDVVRRAMSACRLLRCRKYETLKTTKSRDTTPHLVSSHDVDWNVQQRLDKMTTGAFRGAHR